MSRSATSDAAMVRPMPVPVARVCAADRTIEAASKAAAATTASHDLDMGHRAIRLDAPTLDPVVMVEAIRSGVKTANGYQRVPRRLRVSGVVGRARLDPTSRGRPIPREA